jgi:hypothetical protein
MKPNTYRQYTKISTDRGWTHDYNANEGSLFLSPCGPVPDLRHENPEHDQIDDVSRYQLGVHHIYQAKGAYPITYGPILPPISAMKAFLIPASLYMAIFSGDGPFGPPAPGGGPCTFIIVKSNE